MSTIDSLSTTIIQNALNQLQLSQPSTTGQAQGSSSGTPAASTSATNASAGSSATGSTIVSLGGNSTAVQTYNSLGQLNSAQLQQLEQTISSEVSNAVNALFPSGSPSSTDMLSTLPSPGTATASSSVTPSQIAQDIANANNAVTDTMASLFAGATNQSASNATDLTSLFTSPMTSLTGTASSTPATAQAAIIAMQNAIANKQGSA